MARRILLIARDMVGDLVNTTGAVAWLRERFPANEFVLEGGAAAPELFPEIEVLVRRRRGGLPEKFGRVGRFRKGGFDAAVVLDDSREAARLARLARIPNVVSRTRAVLKPDAHDLFDVLEAALGEFSGETVDFSRLSPRLPLSADHRARAENVMPEGAVLFHIGASDPAKAWPVGRWIELAKLLGDRAVLGAGPADAEIEQVREATGLPRLPEMPLLDYAAAIERAGAIVTADTGPAHLAGAVGTFAVVLYGPTDPRRFHPWGECWTAIRHDLGCEHYGRGCAHQVRGVCSRACIGAITAAEVRDALLARPN